MEGGALFVRSEFRLLMTDKSEEGGGRGGGVHYVIYNFARIGRQFII